MCIYIYIYIHTHIIDIYVMVSLPEKQCKKGELTTKKTKAEAYKMKVISLVS